VVAGELQPLQGRRRGSLGQRAHAVRGELVLVDDERGEPPQVRGGAQRAQSLVSEGVDAQIELGEALQRGAARERVRAGRTEPVLSQAQAAQARQRQLHQVLDVLVARGPRQVELDEPAQPHQLVHALGDLPQAQQPHRGAGRELGQQRVRHGLELTSYPLRPQSPVSSPRSSRCR
jgi:hypothetical protein